VNLSDTDTRQLINNSLSSIIDLLITPLSTFAASVTVISFYFAMTTVGATIIFKAHKLGRDFKPTYLKHSLDNS